MKDLQSLLRDGDPIAREAELSPADVARMRQRLRASAPLPAPPGRPLFAAIAVAMVLLAFGGAWITRRVLPVQPATDVAPGAVSRAGAAPEATQLQLVTPGGTRVFWTLRPKGR